MRLIVFDVFVFTPMILSNKNVLTLPPIAFAELSNVAKASLWGSPWSTSALFFLRSGRLRMASEGRSRSQVLVIN